MKLLNLASGNSLWRGVDYHHEKRVVSWEKVDNGCYQGKVKGSGSVVYDVYIDPAHPRRSTCNCPFAEGRRVICKHMVALYLNIFPEKEQELEEYIEEQQALYDLECEKLRKTREQEITDYVMGLSKAELREALIQRMMSD